MMYKDTINLRDPLRNNKCSRQIRVHTNNCIVSPIERQSIPIAILRSWYSRMMHHRVDVMQQLIIASGRERFPRFCETDGRR